MAGPDREVGHTHDLIAGVAGPARPVGELVASTRAAGTRARCRLVVGDRRGDVGGLAPARELRRVESCIGPGARDGLWRCRASRCLCSSRWPSSSSAPDSTRAESRLSRSVPRVPVFDDAAPLLLRPGIGAPETGSRRAFLQRAPKTASTPRTSRDCALPSRARTRRAVAVPSPMECSGAAARA